MTGIYVLPTEEGLPPRAILTDDTDVQLGDRIEGTLVVWSRDSGVWELNGVPLPSELGGAITAHAVSLGVEW